MRIILLFSVYLSYALSNDEPGFQINASNFGLAVKLTNESAYFDNLSKLMPERRSYIDDDTDEWNSEWKQGKLVHVKFKSRC